jgi:hypothetical protein
MPLTVRGSIGWVLCLTDPTNSRGHRILNIPSDGYASPSVAIYLSSISNMSSHCWCRICCYNIITIFSSCDHHLFRRKRSWHLACDLEYCGICASGPKFQRWSWGRNNSRNCGWRYCIGATCSSCCIPVMTRKTQAANSQHRHM